MAARHPGAVGQRPPTRISERCACSPVVPDELRRRYRWVRELAELVGLERRVAALCAHSRRLERVMSHPAVARELWSLVLFLHAATPPVTDWPAVHALRTLG